MGGSIVRPLSSFFRLRGLNTEIAQYSEFSTNNRTIPPASNDPRPTNLLKPHRPSPNPRLSSHSYPHSLAPPNASPTHSLRPRYPARISRRKLVRNSRTNDRDDSEDGGRMESGLQGARCFCASCGEWRTGLEWEGEGF